MQHVPWARPPPVLASPRVWGSGDGADLAGLSCAGRGRARPPARAGELIFQAFDAAPLNASEKRLLQTALAAQGDYRGPLDGDWGAASRAALAAYAAREFGAAAAERPRRRAGPRLPRRGGRERLGLQLPARARRVARPAARAPRPARARGGRRAALDRRRPADRAHPPLRRRARPGAGTPRRSRPTPARRRSPPCAGPTCSSPRRARGTGGASTPARTAPAAHWATVFLAGEPDQAGALNLAAGSIRPGGPLPWDLPGARPADRAGQRDRGVPRRSRPATRRCGRRPGLAARRGAAAQRVRRHQHRLGLLPRGADGGDGRARGGRLRPGHARRRPRAGADRVRPRPRRGRARGRPARPATGCRWPTASSGSASGCTRRGSPTTASPAPRST